MTIDVTAYVDGPALTAAGSTISLTHTFTAGDILHICVICDTGFTVLTLTCAGQVLTKLDSIDDGANEYCSHWYSDAMLGGSQTLLATFSSASADFRAIGCNIIQGSSGYGSAHAMNDQALPTTGTDATTSTATGNASSQPCIMSAFSINIGQGNPPPAAGTSFTSVGTGFNFDSVGPLGLRSEKSARKTVVTGFAATFTASNNHAHSTMAALFLESGGGGGSVHSWAKATNTIGGVF